jgi:hypothetical protein
MVLRLFMVARRYRFLPIIFIYFALTVTVALIGVIRSSSITPLVLFLLLTRRIIVFILFCALLFNSKMHFNSINFIPFLIIPIIVTLLLNPTYFTNLSYRFVNHPALIFFTPSVILVVCSVRNLNVAQRT